MKEELTKLGLTENESKIYIALLELGSTNAGAIIKKVKLHRNIVYDNLDKLIEKGLASFVLVGNIKHFEATSSSELRAYVNKRKVEILNEEKIVRDLLPEINKIRISNVRKQEATIFKGKRGLKTILDETTQSKTELLVFGTGWGMIETMGSYWEQWHLKLRQNKIKCNILLPLSKKGKSLAPFKEKYLQDVNIIPSTIAVYENKVLNIIWGEEPIAILIVSDKVADSYREYFNLLWRLAKS